MPMLRFVAKRNETHQKKCFLDPEGKPEVTLAQQNAT